METWKPVKDFEELYEVSDCGRVKSLRSGKLMGTIDNGHGYLAVALTKDGLCKKYYVHRLVGQAFVPNPEKLPQINHKDEDKANNFADNLEWCDATYNNNYGTHIERCTKNSPSKKAIQAFDTSGNLIYEFTSIKEAHRQGFNRGGVHNALNFHKDHLYEDLVWKYADPEQGSQYDSCRVTVPVQALNDEGEVVLTFKSYADAKRNQYYSPNINRAIKANKKYKGYYWNAG